ncbi:MAG: cysteine desulfurase [Lacunisphaera sp.]|nr:cysteine desulfurase [Lacunisphaera sp.]
METVKLIYLDNQATTPTDPRVLHSMIGFLQASNVGNPHSEHFLGRRAANAVEDAREKVAALIGARAEEIIFTSGATEANNIALQGIARAGSRRGNHIVTCATEHKCVLECVHYLGESGFETTILPVGNDGLLNVDDLAAAITDRTTLVSIMAANNEIGVLQPIDEISKLCRSHEIVFHSDAAQAAGKVPFDVGVLGTDLVSLSGHKLYAPIGIGALFVSDGAVVRPEPIFRGGGQERGLRSGTVAAHLVVAMGAAAEIAKAEMAKDAAHADGLRSRFLEIVQARLPTSFVNSAGAPRLPGNLSISFPGIDADRLVGALQPHVAVSTNAACSSGVMQASHVLRALGLTDDLAESTIRVGFGRFNTVPEVEAAACLVCEKVENIRGDVSSSGNVAA